MPTITINDLTVNYLNKDKTINTALENFSVTFFSGKVNTVLGESGSGKTTLLRAICKQFAFDGDIYFDDKNILNIKREKMNVAYVDQNLFLYSNMIVYDILAFPLKQLKLKSNEIDLKVKQFANDFGLSLYLTRKPNQLSIGQRQKVSIAKSLIRNPSILLLDEPFSNLSLEDKDEIISILKKIQKENNITTIFVSHSLDEAIKISDYVFVINSCDVVFSGTVNDMLHNSDNEYLNSLKLSEKL